MTAKRARAKEIASPGVILVRGERRDKLCAAYERSECRKFGATVAFAYKEHDRGLSERRYT